VRATTAAETQATTATGQLRRTRRSLESTARTTSGHQANNAPTIALARGAAPTSPAHITHDATGADNHHRGRSVDVSIASNASTTASTCWT